MKKKQDLKFDYWIGDDIVGVAEFSGYNFSISDIFHDLFTSQPKMQIIEWQGHLSEHWDFSGENRYLNYKSYCIGYRYIKDKNKIKQTTMNKSIRPSHYKKEGIEVILFTNSHNLNFNIGNVVKYIVRSPYKGKEVEDLQKALQYLKFEKERISRTKYIHKIFKTNHLKSKGINFSKFSKSHNLDPLFSTLLKNVLNKKDINVSIEILEIYIGMMNW